MNKFCLYEGPKDNVNYWRYFRIISEDYQFVRFFQIFTDHKTTNSNIDQKEENVIGNKVTCFDTDYGFNVSLNDQKDFINRKFRTIKGLASIINKKLKK